MRAWCRPAGSPTTRRSCLPSLLAPGPTPSPAPAWTTPAPEPGDDPVHDPTLVSSLPCQSQGLAPSGRQRAGQWRRTLGLAPGLLHAMVTVRLVPLEDLGPLLDDGNVGGHSARGGRGCRWEGRSRRAGDPAGAGDGGWAGSTAAREEAGCDEGRERQRMAVGGRAVRACGGASGRRGSQDRSAGSTGGEASAERAPGTR